MIAEPVVAIAEAVADVRGTQPTELDLVVDDYINTDAIHRLAADADASWSLTFRLPDETVTITSDGVVAVDGAQQRQMNFSAIADD